MNNDLVELNIMNLLFTKITLQRSPLLMWVTVTSKFVPFNIKSRNITNMIKVKLSLSTRSSYLIAPINNKLYGVMPTHNCKVCYFKQLQ